MHNSSLNSLFDDNKMSILENDIGSKPLPKSLRKQKKVLLVKKTLKYDPDDDPVAQMLQSDLRRRSQTVHKKKNSAR